MKVFNFKSYPEALDALKNALDRRSFDPDVYHIVLTPDRYTLHVENALFKGGGALDLEVLTLSRLCRRVNGNAKTLSREGGVMLTARAIADEKDSLTYYKRAAHYPDFAREVYDTVLQAKASAVEFDVLSASGVLKAKLNDLALIKKRYDLYKQDYSDPSDKLIDLIEKAEDSPLIRNSRFYAIGYSNATRLNEAVFKTLAKYSRSFEFYDALGEPPNKTLRVYRAPDAVTQYKTIASRIRDHVFKGGRYGDVAIVCTEPRTLSRILREYEIDFYTDTGTPLSETPPFSALYCVYRLKTASDAQSLVALCKNPFSGCAAQDAEALENYLSERGVEYGVTDLTISDPQAKKAFERACDILKKFGGSFADACDAVAEFCDFDGTGKKLYAAETDAVTPVRSLVSLIRQYGTDDFDGNAAAFFSAARAVSVKSLPRYSDCVAVCAPQSLRMTRCKLLFIADFNEGVLPVQTKDGGLLCDSELAATGGAIEPSVREQNRRDRAELLAVINNAVEVFCSYSTAGGARRSSFINECATDTVELDFAEEQAALLRSNDAALIARIACTPAAAREAAARRSTAHSQAIADAVGPGYSSASPFKESIVGINKKSLSVSELTHWFSCPYKRFLSDSIGLKERRRGGMGAPDFGLIVHEFMKVFISDTALDCSRNAVERIIDGILDRSGLAVKDSEREKLIRDACDYAAANKTMIEAGNYRPKLTEFSFGGRITLGKCGTPFVGIIDRVDGCGERVRIIDYKTGHKKFDIKKCLDGSDLQLPMYAAALADSGAEVTGIFYMPLRKLYDDTDTRLVGCMVKDEQIAIQYDNALASGSASSVIPAQLKIGDDGKPVGFKRPSSLLMEKDDFAALIDSSVRIAGVAADEINSGYIDRSPTAQACKYCAYGGICVGSRKVRGEPCDETSSTEDR